jgi:biotin-dependent carboxylase-like uncharacterized protein
MSNVRSANKKNHSDTALAPRLETEAVFRVNNPGMLSLLQDSGRYGAFNIGLTNGGPLDKPAFHWANRLCGNELNNTAIEVSIGGLALVVCIDTVIAVTGANMPLTINGQVKELWRSYFIKAGDNIELGYASQGMRCYIAVYGGFQQSFEVLSKSFGSSATVCRESVGGLHGNGSKLLVGDVLLSAKDKSRSSAHNSQSITLLKLPESQQPQYANQLMLRTIPSYQQRHFSSVQQRLFFSSEYQVSARCDRMGYRLEGKAIQSDVNGILSEGICHGAVQLPSDGQPIVLLNDRQTIGGYPKIGAVIALDTAQLAQARQGDKVHFEPITMEYAHNVFHLQLSLFTRTQLIDCS